MYLNVTCVCVCVYARLEDGRLLDYLVAHDELMEEKVAFFIRETLEALQHLHTCRVAHLDLKVRTICVRHIDEDWLDFYLLNILYIKDFIIHIWSFVILYLSPAAWEHHGRPTLSHPLHQAHRPRRRRPAVCSPPVRPPLAWKPRVCCPRAHPRDTSLCRNRRVERRRAGLRDAQRGLPISGRVTGGNLRQHLPPGLLLPGRILPRCEPGGEGFCVLGAAAGSQEEAERYLLSAAPVGGPRGCPWWGVLQDAPGHNTVGHIHRPKEAAAWCPAHHQYQRAGEQQYGQHTVTERRSECPITIHLRPPGHPQQLHNISEAFKYLYYLFMCEGKRGLVPGSFLWSEISLSSRGPPL